MRGMEDWNENSEKMSREGELAFNKGKFGD
jgi:hypothetical protein